MKPLRRVGIRKTSPRWPTLLLATMAVLATLSLVQGIIDVVIPAVRGEEPFGFLFHMTSLLGLPFLVGYVFVHNLGLACVVPGFGFVASRFERHLDNRRLIGLILVGAVIASLLTGLLYLIQAAPRFNLAFALPLFLAEALGILLLAWPSAREMRGFVPTPVYAWSLITPFRNLRVPMVASVLVLSGASLVEGYVILAA